MDAIDCIRLYDGVRAGLTVLTARGVVMGIVTNLPKWLVYPILCELTLERYFKTSVFAARKPAPQGLLSAVECLGRTNAAVYYLGDMANDALAAQRANLPFAWAAYGYGVRRPSNVAAVIRRFDEVLAL
jgi:phosphoglycolate phosphatase